VLARRFVHAEGLDVACREDRGRRVGQPEHAAGRLQRRGVVEVADGGEAAVDGDPGTLEGGPVPVEAGPAAQQFGSSGNGPDPAVAQIDQVLGRGHAARPVRRADRRHVRRRLADRVDDDDRNVKVGQTRPVIWREFGEHEDHAVRPAGGQAVQPALALALVGGGRDGEPGPGAQRGLLGPADDLGRPRAQLGEDQVDQAGPAPLARRPRVPQVGHGRLDPRPRGRRDIRSAAQGLRRGRDGHLRSRRHVRQGHPDVITGLLRPRICVIDHETSPKFRSIVSEISCCEVTFALLRLSTVAGTSI
jgi:hypothetical protein